MHCLRIGVQPIHSFASRCRAGLLGHSAAVHFRASGSFPARITPAAHQSAVVAHATSPSGSSSSDDRADELMLDEDIARMFSHAMPKAEIGALRFLQEHPEFDGRGVKICIFDTGVDPGAAGLQVTTDGKPKIIDVIDCTGSGDVDTTRVERADPGGCIAGASGRRLALNPGWTNPTGEWRVGCKHVYDLVSRGLVTRLKAERRKGWEEAQRGALAEAVAALARFDKANPAPKLGANEAAKRERAELEARVAALKELAKSYEDPGPLLDCVVWHDGAAWRAALDTRDLHPPGSGRGALADFTPLTNYAAEHKYGTFSELDSCNFVLNILDGGSTLSIVVDCGAHGTHVAGITAAHFPDDPGSNGIAPGAQIISCKIGDTRLGSMETGTGVVRGIIAARQLGAHLINMSYGEPTTTPNHGRVVELATELVRKHGVIFVASAGNAGPALSTVGAPGGTTSALFGVGAYVSPQLASAGHSVLVAPPAGLQYTWSSRGPAADGHTGVAFSAPGGAIAPVPTWTQQRRQLMNGTSMSSPNAAGGIALLLSGLLATGRPVSPHGVRRALENTALPLGGASPDAVLTYGRGLIQVDAAWEYLTRDPAPPPPPASAPAAAGGASSSSRAAPGPWYEVEASCSEGRGPVGRGIYLREPHESAKPQSYRITVTPKLPEAAANCHRLDLEERLVLESSVPWVTCPPALLLHHGGRSFDVQVDPSGLPPGLHTGEVAALRVEARDEGPLFRLPVTLIKPLQVPLGVTAAASTASVGANGSANGPNNGSNGSVGTLSLGPLSFTPGAEFRSFIAVPPGASWVELTLRAGPHPTPKLFLLRATQLRPEAAYRNHELRTQVTLSGGSEYLTSAAVVGGCTLELTVAQFWSSAGEAELEQVELSFYGVGVSAEGGGSSGGRPGGELALDGAEGAKKVLVSAPVWGRSVRVKPEAKLTSLHIPLRPTEAALEPLSGERDALTDGRVIYRLLLTYKTSLAEAGKYRPCLPLINKQIYDSPLESPLVSLHDGSTRQTLAVQGADPEAVSLRKGDLTVRVAVRHDSAELLDKMRAMPLVLKRSLDGGGVSVPVYGSRRDAVLSAGGAASPAGEVLLRPGDVAPLWLGPLPDDKLPKDATPGRLLVGQLSLGQLKRGGGAAPAKHRISYLVPPAPPAGNGNGAGNGSKDKEGRDEDDKAGPDERLAEAVRDAKIKLLKELKLSDPAQASLYDSLYGELAGSHPGHLPLLTEHLKKMDGREASVRSTPGGLAAVVAAADGVIGAVDGGSLAAFLGVKAAEDSAEYRKAKREMDERKAALVDALARKAAALMEAEEEAAEEEALAEQLAEALAEQLAEKAKAEKAKAEKAKAEAEAKVEAAAEAREAADGDDGAEPKVEAEAASAAPAPAAASGAADAPQPQPTAAAATGVDAIAACMQELRKWVDTSSDSAHLLLHARAEARAGRYASALKSLDKLLGSDDKGAASAAGRREVSDLKCKMFAALGWRHCEAQERALQAVRFRKDLPLM